MKEKTKTDADRKLIKQVFACEPVDWARYPDGKLSFISPTGQKFTYTEEQFENIQEAVRQERAATKKLSSRKAAPKSKKEKLPEPEPTSNIGSGGRGG